MMAAGGLRGRTLTPMARRAQMAPADTWRVVGDRSDVPEAYIPLDGSPRSIALLLEAFRRMPNMEGMTAGGVSGAVQSTAAVAPINVNFNGDQYAYDPKDLMREARDKFAQAMAAMPRI